MKLITYDRLYIDTLIRKRANETRLGECVQTLPWNAGDHLPDHLAKNNCRYVLIGLPEDVGVRANGGRGGTYSAWQPVLNTLLNTQSNSFLTGDDLLVLGHFDFSAEMEEAKAFDFHKAEDLLKARAIVDKIDNAVYPVIQQIIESGKEAIVVGGGHNNAFPCIKGAAAGLFNAKKISGPAINVINCDAHSDFRPLEGRHSGNAFSYAFSTGCLGKYSIIGLHESYNTGPVMDLLNKNAATIHYSTFEDIYIREHLTFSQAIKDAIKFTADNFTGLEIDLDAVQNIPSSAKTSSGISPVEARKYIHKVATSTKVVYFHIAEAAPVLSHIKTDLKTGKLVSYFICDYIKARNHYHSNN